MLKMKSDYLIKSVDELMEEVEPERAKDIRISVPMILNVLEKLLIRRKVFNYYEENGINEQFVAAAFLFRAFSNPNDIPSIFILRQKAQKVFSKNNVPAEIQRGVLQICENYKGEDSLMESLIPQKGYPDDIFADAIWICETFLREE